MTVGKLFYNDEIFILVPVGMELLVIPLLGLVPLPSCTHKVQRPRVTDETMDIRILKVLLSLPFLNKANIIHILKARNV